MSEENTTQYPVAVYGTLRQGDGNHRLLRGRYSEMKKGVVKGLGMVSSGGFPYAYRKEDSEIVVEMYTINQDEYAQVSRNLDGLEGINYGHYTKELVDVTFEDGTTAEAHIYLGYNNGHFNPNRYQYIESGDWMKYIS